MNKPKEAPWPQGHLDDGVSYHVQCDRCPLQEERHPYGTLYVHPYVCQDGCYETEAEARRGLRRHLAWHNRRGE